LRRTSLRVLFSPLLGVKKFFYIYIKKSVSTETYDLFTCNGKFDEVLYYQGVTQGVVTPYTPQARGSFSLINPLTAFSQVFKPKPYLNVGSEAREASLCRKYIFYISTGWSLYSTSCKPKGKSSDLFLKVYDKLPNNPC
jgi:hypothetical protein